MHRKRLFVFSLSFNPARLLCFFKYGTWKMRSLLQAEKRIWPQAEGCAFLRGETTASTFSDSQSRELHLPLQGRPLALPRTPPAAPHGDRGKWLSKQDFLWTALEHPDVFQRRQKKIAGEHFKDCSSRSQQRKKKREKEQFQQPLSSPLPGMKGSWELGPPLRAVAMATEQHHRPGRQSREPGTGRWACWSQITRWASPRGSCACEALLLGTARRLFIDPTNSKLGLGLQPRRATVLANSSRKRQ